MKKIVFRADAAPHIGIGDLMSLINISMYFDETYETFFIIKDYKAGVDLIDKYNVDKYFIIETNISIEDEVEYINDFIDKQKIDIVFFEITERKLSDYIGINSAIKKVAVNFDGYILNDMDLVIDWSVEAYKIFDTNKYSKTEFLLGPKYVILPKDFYSSKVINRKVSNSNYKKILIAMGGADEFNFTGKVVEAILRSNIDVELNIIIGSGYEYKEELEKRLKDTTFKYNVKQNITNMLDEYLTCDIGIGAGGLTSSELVATNTSAILIATYEHQVDRCVYFDKMGWVKYLGYKKFDENDLIDAIQNPIILNNKKIFNSFAIVESINKIMEKKNV